MKHWSFLFLFLFMQLFPEIADSRELFSGPKTNLSHYSTVKNKKKVRKKKKCRKSEPPPASKENQSNKEFHEYLLPANQKVTLSSWVNPSLEDYRILQNYLHSAKRPELALLDFSYCTLRQNKMRHFKLLPEVGEPEFKIINFNPLSEVKDRCIVTYISHNNGYKENLERLIHSLHSAGFTGHLIYRVGGWPYLEEGGLELFDVPYAFKPLALLEAKKLGYQQAIWVDVPIQVLQNLDPVFDHIENEGLCFFSFQDFKHPHRCSNLIAHSLGTTVKEFEAIKPITTAVVGFSFTDEKGLQLLDAWHQAAKKKLGFLSPNSECPSLSSLINKQHLLASEGDPSFFTSQKKEISPQTVFFLHTNE